MVVKKFTTNLRINELQTPAILQKQLVNQNQYKLATTNFKPNSNS